MSIGGAFVTLSKVVDTVTKGANGLYAAFNLLKGHPIITLLTLGTIAVGAWIANFDAIKQGFHDLINDMSEYFNNSTFGKWYNATIKPAGGFIDKATSAAGDWIGGTAHKFVTWLTGGKSTNELVKEPATNRNKHEQSEQAKKFWAKVRGEEYTVKPFTAEDEDPGVPAPKIPTPQPVATPDKQPPAESREDVIFQALTANFARMGHAVKELSNAQLAPAGALGGGTNGKVTIGSNNSTTVNNYIEVNAQGNASADDIAEKTAGATAQATTQATVDTSDKGTFQ